MDLAALVQTFPAVEFAMGYGSGVLPQKGYESEGRTERPLLAPHLTLRLQSRTHRW